MIATLSYYVCEGCGHYWQSPEWPDRCERCRKHGSYLIPAGSLGAAEQASERALECRSHRHTYGTDHGRRGPACVYCGEVMAL